MGGRNADQGVSLVQKCEPGNRCEMHNSAQFAFCSPCLRTSQNPAVQTLRNATRCNTPRHFTRDPAIAKKNSAIGSARCRKANWEKIAAKCTNLHNSPFIRHKRNQPDATSGRAPSLLRPIRPPRGARFSVPAATSAPAYVAEAVQYRSLGRDHWN
jgi:hypothetical protein